MADRLPAKLANESALGVYRFSWTSADGARMEVQWGAGIGNPLMFRRNVAREVANPERFGWKTPRNPADFKRFAQAVADEFEAGYDDDELAELQAGKAGRGALEDPLANPADDSSRAQATQGAAGQVIPGTQGERRESEPSPQAPSTLHPGVTVWHPDGPAIGIIQAIEEHHAQVAFRGLGVRTLPVSELSPIRPGDAITVTIPHARPLLGDTRRNVTVRQGEYVGPVDLEPSLSHVRIDGTLRRVPTEYIGLATNHADAAASSAAAFPRPVHLAVPAAPDGSGARRPRNPLPGRQVTPRVRGKGQ